MARTHVGAVLRHIQHLIDSSAEDLHDAALLQRFAQNRDEAALTVLVRRHGGLVLNVCRHILHHESDTEDAFQATFLVLARQANSIRKQTSIASWLHGVAFRTAMNLRKSAMRRQHHEKTVEERRSLESPVSEAAFKELQVLLDEEIQRLAECYRAPFVLCCLEGKSRLEAAQTLGCKEGTVSSRLAKARKLLQDRLTTRGITLSAALAAAALTQSETSAAVAATLATTTIHAALAFAAGKASGAVSSHVVVMAEGVLQGMFMAKLKLGVAAALVVLLGMVAAGAHIAQQEAVQQSAKKENDAKTPIVAAEPIGAKQARTDLFGDHLPDGAAARLGTVRFRHEGNATALAFTADGKTLVGYTNAGVRVWDSTTGLERHRLPLRMPNGAHGMDISPDGKLLAVSESAPGNETRIGLWDLQSGKKTRTLSLPKEESQGTQFWCLLFTRDGKSLTVNTGGKAIILDPASGQVRTSFGLQDSQRFYNLAVSPDCKTLAAAVHHDAKADPAKRSVQLWDIVTGKLIRVIHEQPAMGGETFVRSIAFSPDAKTLAFGTFDSIMVFDPSTGKKLGQFDAKGMGQITGLAFIPDGSKLISGGEYDGAIRVWDVASGKALHVLDGRMFMGRSLALSPDGKTVALGSPGQTVRLWDVDTGKDLFAEYQGHDSQINSLAFSPDGKTLVSAGEYRQVFLWSSASRKRIGIIRENASTLSLAPDGKQLAAGNVNKVRILDMDTGKETSMITVPGVQSVTSATFSPTGTKLFTLDFTHVDKGVWKHSVRHWNIATGKQEHSWPIPPEISWRSSLAHDGKTVLTTQELGIGMHNVETGRTKLLRSEHRAWNATLSPDGRMLGSATARSESAVQLWETVTGKETFLLKGHQGSVVAIVWSTDGRLLASGDTCDNSLDLYASQTVRVWDASTGKQLASFGGFKSDVTALTFSPDGATLVAGLRDSTILIWEVDRLDPRLIPSPELNKDALESRWNDLLSDNAGQAHQAIGALVASPRQTVPFLQARVKPTPVADLAKVQRWIADLNSDTFAVRQSAAQELVRVDTQAIAPIQRAMMGKLSVETRRRLEQVLSTVSDVPDPSAVRTIRAIMALEKIGSPEALSVLEALARGAPSARPTEEADASLKRLSKRASPARSF